MVELTTTHVVICERDAYNLGWMARVRGMDDCRGYGRNLPRAANDIRACLARRLGLDPADIRLEVRISETITAVAKQALRARREAERATERANREVAAAVRKLTALGLSRRDVGEVLGLSHQRIQQLVDSGNDQGLPSGEVRP